MMRPIIKDLAYYEALPYKVEIGVDDEGDFVGRILELKGCIAHGDSPATALESLKIVQKMWLEVAIAAGTEIPEPKR